MIDVSEENAPGSHRLDKTVRLAMRLAHAESALRAMTLGQVDAIVDPDGHAYLLRPAQEYLQRSEHRLRAILDSGPDAIMVVDRGGTIQSQTRAAKRVLGFEPEEMVGKRLFDRVHEADMQSLYVAYFNVIEGFEEHATVRFRHRDREEFDRLVEAAISPLRGFSPPSVVIAVRPAMGPPRRSAGVDWSPGG